MRILSHISFRLVSLTSSETADQSMASYPKPVVIEADEGQHTATIIFAHGLGDTGEGWASTIQAIKPSHVKLICPTAASIPVKINMGMKMPSWFDLYSLSIDGPEDAEGIKRSSAYITSLIEEEKTKYNIPENRILIGGFSQGGALSLHTALRHPNPLAGVIALSCWLPLHAEYPGVFCESNKNVPVLQCHGDEDPLVPTVWGGKTAEILKPLMSNYSFKTYPGLSHSSCDEVRKNWPLVGQNNSHN